MSFFDNDDEDDNYPVQPRAGPSRPARTNNRVGRAPSIVSATTTTSAGAGSRSFLSRLGSTVSPGRSDPYRGQEYDDDMLEDEVHRAEGRLDDLELDGEGGPELDDEDEGEMDDVRKMGKVWVKERGTVDLMSWEGDLIDTLFDKLEQQVCRCAYLLPAPRMWTPLRSMRTSRCPRRSGYQRSATFHLAPRADGAAKDGRHVTLRSPDIRRRTLQARARQDRDGTRQVCHPVICPHEAAQGESASEHRMACAEVACGRGTL
jgi:hypothetical protein